VEVVVTAAAAAAESALTSARMISIVNTSGVTTSPTLDAKDCRLHECAAVRRRVDPWRRPNARAPFGGEEKQQFLGGVDIKAHPERRGGADIGAVRHR
jgi:activator of HSP90 ATPase